MDVFLQKKEYIMEQTKEQKIKAFLDAYDDAKSVLFEKCTFIANEMRRAKESFYYIDSFSFDIYDGEMNGEGQRYCMGDVDVYEETLETEMLTMTEDEIVKRVDDIINKKKIEREQMLKERKERQRQKDFDEYIRLKKSLGL